MRTKKSYIEIRKDNLSLLQNLREKESKLSKGSNSNTHLLVFSILVFLIALIVVYNLKADPKMLYHLTHYDNVTLTKDTTTSSKSIVFDSVQQSNTTTSSPFISHTSQQTTNIEATLVKIGLVEFIWQKSNFLTSTNKQKGIIFLAHGCKHQPTEWFTSCNGCPIESHIGLPMEVSLVKYMLYRGFTVVAMKPTHNMNKTQCWHPNDKEHVTTALNYVYSELQTNNVVTPLHAIGVANGGIFLGNHAESLYLTNRLKITSMAMLNCGIWHTNYKRDKYPAVLFVDTSRNSDLCAVNNISVSTLQSKGIAASQLVSEPIPITPDYFYHGLNDIRIINRNTDLSNSNAQQSQQQLYTVCEASLLKPIVSPLVDKSLVTIEESKALYDALVSNDYLWPANGVLLKDPSVDRYLAELRLIAMRAIPRVVPSKDKMEWNNSPIVQLLRVAWGFKQEISNEYMKEIVDWFDQSAATSTTSSGTGPDKVL